MESSGKFPCVFPAWIWPRGAEPRGQLEWKRYLIISGRKVMMEGNQVKITRSTRSMSR
jgi:hypothetical protein